MKSNRTLQQELWVHRYPYGMIVRLLKRRALYQFLGHIEDPRAAAGCLLVFLKLDTRTYCVIDTEIKANEYEIVNFG